MIRSRLGWIVVALFCVSSDFVVAPAAAAGVVDRIRFGRNSEAGEIVDTSPTEVKLDKGSNGTRRIAVNEIRSVHFDGEPPELTRARLGIRNGGYVGALDKLREIDQSEVDRDLVRQDIAFYQALCAAKLALSGQGQITDAGRQLNEFVRSHPNSFHYLEAVEAMGDLLTASGKYSQAERQYAKLAKAPWPDYQMRAGVLAGRSLQAQDNHAEAIRRFDAVLAINDQSPLAREQTLAATLAKAISLAKTNRLDEAVEMIERVIRQADPEQIQLQARAYNALGACYEQAGKTKDALLAYLHVDVLYSALPEAHIEALTHLVPLWRSIGQEERAREAQQLLSERYGSDR